MLGRGAIVSFVNMSKPLEMSFGLQTHVDPKKHVIDRGLNPHGNGQF